MTLVETESDGGVYMYIAESRSTDLATDRTEKADCPRPV